MKKNHIVPSQLSHIAVVESMRRPTIVHNELHVIEFANVSDAKEPNHLAIMRDPYERFKSRYD